jgi:hypothetical protein
MVSHLADPFHQAHALNERHREYRRKGRATSAAPLARQYHSDRQHAHGERNSSLRILIVLHSRVNCRT